MGCMNGVETHGFVMLKVSLQIALIASTMSFGAASSSFAQAAEGYQCRKAEDVRRIEIRFKDDIDQLPCRVVYRPETENDSVGTVSWRGITELERCQAQAAEVVDRLIAEGWDCAIEAEQLETSPSEIQEVTLSDGQPALDDTDQAPNSEQLEEPKEPPKEEESQEPFLVENPDLDAPLPELIALLNQDLGKLATALDGSLRAEIVAYDDLNADDVADALVLLTYNSPQPAYRQFLAAYLFDGENYQLTATRPIASSSSNTKNATIDDVDQGIIKVTLQGFEPGDQSCCPSGIRQISLALRDLDLIEIDRKALTR